MHYWLDHGLNIILVLQVSLFKLVLQVDGLNSYLFKVDGLNSYLFKIIDEKFKNIFY